MTMLLQYASDRHNPFFDKHLKPNIVEIKSFEELIPYISRGNHGGVIIDFLSDTARSMYDNLPEYVQLMMTIYDDWVE